MPDWRNCGKPRRFVKTHHNDPQLAAWVRLGLDRRYRDCPVTASKSLSGNIKLGCKVFGASGGLRRDGGMRAPCD
jgi:hypothetical protein